MFSTGIKHKALYLVAVPVALATSAYQAFAAVTVDGSGTISIPQAEIDTLGQTSVNGATSLLSIFMQGGKWFVIFGGVFLVYKGIKGLFTNR